MAQQLVKLFGREIQENLFPMNDFYKRSRLDGGIELKAGIVQVPQAGAVPGVQVNPSTFPLTVGKRTDDIKEYNVDLIATDPIHIQDVEEITTNYDKRSDVLKDHTRQLNTTVADIMAYAWAKAVTTATMLTTGSARPSSRAGGADKKAVTYKDILGLQSAMDKDDIPAEGRYLLASAEMYSDLLDVDQFISFDYKEKAVSNGAIGTILGFTVYKRSRTVFYDDAGALKAYGDAAAATDKDSILAWHEDFVRRAEGNVKVYSDVDKPTYLGSIYNAAVRSGGTFGRKDGKGVYTLVQAEAEVAAP